MTSSGEANVAGFHPPHPLWCLQNTMISALPRRRIPETPPHAQCILQEVKHDVWYVRELRGEAWRVVCWQNILNSIDRHSV